MTDFAKLIQDATAQTVGQGQAVDMQKFAAAVAEQAAEAVWARVNEANERQMIEKQAEDFIAGVRQSTAERIEKISTYKTLVALHQAGVKLSQEVVAALPKLSEMAEEETAAMGDEMADGEMAKEQLLQSLIEGAAQDPEIAAALATEGGTPTSPDEYEGQSDELAALLADELEGVEPTKESSATRAELIKFSQGLPPAIYKAFCIRAERKVMAAMVADPAE